MKTDKVCTDRDLTIEDIAQVILKKIEEVIASSLNNKAATLLQVCLTSLRELQLELPFTLNQKILGLITPMHTSIVNLLSPCSEQICKMMFMQMSYEVISNI